MKNYISLLFLCLMAGVRLGYTQPFQPIQVDAKLACFEGNLSIELRIVSKDSIKVEGGTLTVQNDSTYRVGNIAAGDNIRILQISPNQTRRSDYLVPVIEPEPVSQALVSNVNVCESDLPAKLTAFVPTGQTVDWYDAPNGGTLLAAGKPELEVEKGGKYYAQTRLIGLSCLYNSAARVLGEVSVKKSLCPELMVSRVR